MKINIAIAASCYAALIMCASAGNAKTQITADLPAPEIEAQSYLLSGEIFLDDSFSDEIAAFNVCLSGDLKSETLSVACNGNPTEFKLQIRGDDLKAFKVLEISSASGNINAEIKNLKLSSEKNSKALESAASERGKPARDKIGYAYVDGKDVIVPLDSMEKDFANDFHPSPKEEMLPEKRLNSSGEVFVNAEKGNDSNSGSFAYPKETISSAVNSGASEIVLQENGSRFKSENLNASGKNIILRASGNVIIK